MTHTDHAPERSVAAPVADRAFSSAQYWQDRYAAGGTSGAGSYGRLAVYKAHVVNEMVHRLKVKSVLEYGMGDGHQASLFSVRRYLGVDVSEHAVESCRQKFKTRPEWSFVSDEAFRPKRHRAALGLSLDVIYHLVEDQVFERYMRRLFASARKYVLIYASDHDAVAANPHVRHRCYSDWIEKHQPGWRLSETLEQPFKLTPTSNPRHTSFAFFRLFQHEEAQP